MRRYMMTLAVLLLALLLALNGCSKKGAEPTPIPTEQVTPEATLPIAGSATLPVAGATPSPDVEETEEVLPTSSPTPSASATVSASPNPSPSPSSSPSSSPSPTPSATATASGAPSSSPSAAVTPEATAVPAASGADALVGAWKDTGVDYELTITFGKSGGYTVNADGNKINGSYSASDGKVYIKMDGDAREQSFSISGDTLTLTGDEGSIRYKKVK